MTGLNGPTGYRRGDFMPLLFGRSVWFDQLNSVLAQHLECLHIILAVLFID
jgi:hypothetical protein